MSYSQKNGFSHMASGLVCGFSCVVMILLYRPLDIQSDKSEMLVFDAMLFKRSYLSGSF